MSLAGREILMGVTGGIAAFKTAALVSQLVQAGAGVQVVMTEAAQQFIGPATFDALTGRHTAVGMFRDPEYPLGPHIALAEKADLLCVAPATADFLGKAANGLADDLLSTLVLAFRGPLLAAPAMNSAMWEKAPVQRNIVRLREDGWKLIDPDSGWLSCRQQGTGRMADPERIRAVIEETLRG